MPLSGFLLEHTLQSGNDFIYFSDHLLYSMPEAAQGCRKPPITTWRVFLKPEVYPQIFVAEM